MSQKDEIKFHSNIVTFEMYLIMSQMRGTLINYSKQVYYNLLIILLRKYLDVLTYGIVKTLVNFREIGDILANARSMWRKTCDQI